MFRFIPRLPYLVASTLIATAAACSSSESVDLNMLEIGWRFDYSDFTSSQPANIRGCDNADSAAVTAVEVTATDPNGTLPGFSIPFSCAEGDGMTTMILGVEEGEYEVTAEATVSGDQVLYRLDATTIELDPAVPVTLTLRAAVGELRFMPDVDGVSDCSTAVDSISVELFEIIDGSPATALTTQRFIDEPCDGTDFAEIAVLEIPALPTSTTSGFLQTRYLVRAEADDLDNVRLGCAQIERDVPPGPSDAIGLSFTLDACP